MRLVYWYLLVLAGLSFLTGGLFVAGADYRYEAIGSNLLEDPGFSTHSKSWQINKKQFMAFSADDNALTMSIPPGKDTVGISAIQTVKLPAHGLFRLSAELNAKNITVLPDTWHGGRLLLISLSSEGKPLYKNPHVAAKVFETAGWATESNVFSINENIKQVKAGFQLVGLSGELSARNLELVRVEERAFFSWSKRILLFCWGISMLGGIVRLGFNNGKRGINLFSLLILVLIIFGVTVPHAALEKLEIGIITQVSPIIFQADKSAVSLHQKAGDKRKQESLIPTPLKTIFSVNSAQKIGHFFLFFCLFISFYRNGSATFTRGQVVLICALFAFMTEMLQFFFEGRQASSVDFAIDAAGILLAAVLSKTTQSKFYLHAFIQRLKIW